MPLLKTVALLQDYMATVAEKEVTDDQVIWFNCFREARLIMNTNTTKETAHMLLEGFAAMNTLESVQNSLDTMFDDDADEDELSSNNIYLKCDVAQFYVKHKLLEELEQLF
jgi:hypothetical protein